MGSGNVYTPSISTQINYIVQWFHEWSEMQRGDFMPILLQKFQKSGTVNGLISNMESCNIEDRPPSIFQCRIKLFKEWSDSWTNADKDQLINELKSIDVNLWNKVFTGNGTCEEKVSQPSDADLQVANLEITNGSNESVSAEC